MQRIIAIGTVTSKGEFAKLPDGSRMAKITLTCDDEYTSASGEKHIQEELPLVMWNRKADMAKYINIGDKMFVEGKLKSTTIKVRFRHIRTTEVIVNSFDFISQRRSEQVKAAGVTKPFGLIEQIQDPNCATIDANGINGDDFRQWTEEMLSGKCATNEDNRG